MTTARAAHAALAAPVFVAFVLVASCRKDSPERTPPAVDEPPTPGLVGTWTTIELMGSRTADDEDYWSFRGDGTMVECNTVIGRKERPYGLTPTGFDMGGTDVEIVSIEGGVMHVRFVGIDKKLRKLRARDPRKFRCDEVKGR